MTRSTTTEPNPMRSTTLVLFLVLVAAAQVGCSAGDADEKSNRGDQDTSTGGDFGNQQPDVERPDDFFFKFLTPEAGRDYVFVPNETLDTVSKIDADSLEITSILVGDRPTVLKAPSGRNMAVVLNQDSHEVSIIRADVVGEEGLEDEVVHIDIDPRMNALTLSPDGEYAFAWFSYAAKKEDEPDGNLQTVTLVRTELGAEAAFSLTVGFQIRNIVYRDLDGDDENGVSHVYIVTDTGISVVEMDTVDSDAVLEVIPVSTRTLDDPLDREVQISASGAWAGVRDLGAPELYVVRLSDGAIQTIPLPESATDLDMFPHHDPSADNDHMLAVVRDAQLVLDIPLSDAFEDPENAAVAVDVGDQPIGLASISPDGRYLTLYTTLGGYDELTIVDMDDAAAEPRVIPLRKALLGVALSPDSRFAIVFHPIEETGENPSVAEVIVAQSYAYSIVEFQSGFSRLVLTEDLADDFTFWADEDQTWAFLTFEDETQDLQRLDRIDLETFDVDPLQLGSPPTDIGTVLGRTRIWVNQKHPSGRMTFVDVGTGQPQTVTGFELNRFVR